jgi:CheY-like chemotaxis protein
MSHVNTPKDRGRRPAISFRKRSEGGRDCSGGHSRRPLVLLVDDVANNLLALEGLLTRDDIDIRTASSGQAALEILLEEDVAVAIIDVQMPGMDGFELASLMRGVEKTSYVPIIFVTAGSRGMVGVFTGYEIGAVDYLTKPIDEQALRGKVDVFVSLEKHRQALREMDRMREK